MLRRLSTIAFGVGAAASGLYFHDDLKVFAATMVEKSSQVHSGLDKSLLPSDGPQYNNDPHFPIKPWDHNWDFRDPISLIDPTLYGKADEETRKQMLEKARPTATRNIFLIRHGQYQLDKKESSERRLTELGREQAALLGKRLSETNVKFDTVVMSTMPRAMETANIVLEKLPNVQSKMDSLLEEGAPYPPEPVAYHWKPNKKKFYTEGARIEAAFRKYIHRASVHQKEDSNELVVCHANVIRYFICRALQFPAEGWLRMSLANSSITWIVVRPNGSVSIRTVGDAGHCHPHKITFT
jgi:serine/threonine-protein phosphatase PGAM5